MEVKPSYMELNAVDFIRKWRVGATEKGTYRRTLRIQRTKQCQFRKKEYRFIRYITRKVGLEKLRKTLYNLPNHPL